MTSRITLLLFLMSLVVSLSSCQEKSNNTKVPLKNKKIEKPKSVASKKQSHKQNLDSLKLDSVLKEAINTVKPKLQLKSFFRKYEALLDDSTSIGVEIKLGHLFSNKNKHVMICRTNYEYMLFDIYKIVDNKIENVIKFHNSRSPDFANHSVQDVNGDGYKDFVVHWYPSSGCCRRNIYDVYLSINGTGSFTNQYEFINPTFSTKEKVIRGVLYGHPGEVGLYKYKWNNLKVDTIEFIYPDQSDTTKRHYIKTYKRLYSSKNVKKEKLKFLPKEYRNIESFEWFNDY
ncbi:hypothetical protein [Pedobacter sp.]|uniref:XAC2610-related protein n=1 Tax=Pedobacter sp. TaxID=1411316 RepID=UPI0031E0FD64